MANNNEIKYTQQSQNGDCMGEIRIANEVVAGIAAMAASDVAGVASVGGNAAKDIRGILGMNKLSKGVKVELVEELINIDITLSLEYGHPIPKTCEAVQKKIKTTVENMTGMTVGDVNTHIASVDMNAQE